LVPVRSLDAQTLGAGAPGPVFEKLRAAFADATQRLGVPFAADVAAGADAASRKDG